MYLGLLTDIHEHVDQLREALAILKSKRVDQIVVLGDVFEKGKRIDKTVELLVPLAQFQQSNRDSVSARIGLSGYPWAEGPRRLRDRRFDGPMRADFWSDRLSTWILVGNGIHRVVRVRASCFEKEISDAIYG